jgi:hypothetical protein
MNDLVKYGLIAGGAYIIYEWVIAPYLAAPAVPGTTVVSGSQVTVNQPAATTTPTPQAFSYPAITSQQLYETGNVSGGQTPDQWAWDYHAKTGVWVDGGLMDSIFGVVGTTTRGMNYSAEQFVSMMQGTGQGFQGLAGLSVEKASGYERAIKLAR